jgi:hypothetical protein
MSSPHELIERALATHGDALFRVALLYGDDRGAEVLLRALVTDLIAAPPAAPPDEADMVARLSAVTRADAAKRAGRRGAAPRPPASLPPIYCGLFTLPADQRLALGLNLLLGYDLARLARVTAADEPAARAGLLAAMRAAAPAAGVALTDRTDDDSCLAVREALADPAGRLRHTPAIRGHLAGCAQCRAFDQAWGELSQAVETALRTALRDRSLPAPLEARLLAMARPARRFGPRLRVVLPPLAVLLLIAALVLPGITRRSVTVEDREAAAPVNPQTLIGRALDAQARPPDGDGPIWHAHYQTFWYFDNHTLAPLRADIWLDRSNPARHRLQITHANGGAPYELQIGNGTDRLSYALNALYAHALYGSLAEPATPDRPALISAAADAPAQSRALAERISYGIWDIPPFYLRQAQAAPDLRVLGRQRDGGHTVQILSFSGTSPMGRPADAPDATAERVTVLLALDTADGRMRSASELSGPAGGTQTSRVTWKLIDEQSINSSSAAGSPFDPGQAWNGQGKFPEALSHSIVDPAVPLIPMTSLGDPARLLLDPSVAFWVPATPPAGADRALLIWPPTAYQGQNVPPALVYLGRDRRLIMQFSNFSQIDPGEPLMIGPWSALLEPGRARSYRATLARQDSGGADPSAHILLEAYGFSRAELLAVIESLRPLDAELLSAQGRLFARPT